MPDLSPQFALARNAQKSVNNGEMKNFEINAIEYAVENCTAICAADCGDESKRQDALLVSSERGSPPLTGAWRYRKGLG